LAAPVASGWSDGRVGLAPTESAALSRRTPQHVWRPAVSCRSQYSVLPLELQRSPGVNLLTLSVDVQTMYAGWLSTRKDVYRLPARWCGGHFCALG
jgi:hypothetical protein